MPTTLRRTALLVLISLFAVMAHAADGLTPKPGSPIRKAICDGLRKLYASEYRDEPVLAPASKILFEISILNVKNGWAIFSGAPVVVHQDGRHETLDTMHTAVLHLENKQWKVVKDIGWHGDVVTDNELRMEAPDFPKEILPHMNGEKP
ncbi:MAG: hypothetical protein JNM99_16905 [Verrucomicrobiaceae bacterium]|nr:hypothetical protein [Verrucomicrobiaceae bacterium]